MKATVLHLFEEWARQGKTVVRVTHDKDLAHSVPRQIEIEDGRITWLPGA